MGWTSTKTLFSAGDAERITGLDLARQRDFRRHGYLPALESPKARFDAQALATMLALKALTDNGMTPSAAAKIAPSCGVAIAARLLNDPRGQGGAVELLDGEAVIKSQTEYRWLIARPGGEGWRWASTAAQLADDLGGAAVVIDLVALGETLLNRAGTLVTIEREAA